MNHIPWRLVLLRIIGRTRRSERIWLVVHDYGVEVL